MSTPSDRIDWSRFQGSQRTYDPFVSAASMPDPLEGVGFADYAKSILSGGAGIVSGVGWLTKRLGLEDIGGTIEELGTEAVDFWNDRLSDSAKDALSREIVRKTEDGSGIMGYEWGDPTWHTIGLMGAQSLLGTGAGMGTGAGITKVLQTFANPFGRAALTTAAANGSTQAAKKLKMIDTVLGSAGFGAGEGAIGGMAAGQSVEQQIMQLPPEKLMQNERYRTIYESAQELPELERHAYAAETVAKEAATQAGWQAGLTTSLLGAPMGAYFGRILGGAKLSSTLPRGIATGAAGEAAQEFAQSGFEQYISNIARQPFEPDLDEFEGVLNAAVGGALAGGLLGGGFGAAGVGAAKQEVARERVAADQEASQKIASSLQGAAVAAANAGASRKEVLTVVQEAVAGKIRPETAKLELKEIERQARIANQPEDATPPPEVKAPKVPEKQEKETPLQRQQREAAEEANKRLAERQKKIAPVRPRTKPTEQTETRSDEEVSAATEAIQSRPTGKKQTSFAGQTPVETTYKLVELEDLLPSHDRTGSANPKYPKALQPRDRTRAASKEWLADKAKNFRPELITDGVSMAEGTPVISPDGVVESGNGRVMIMQELYEGGNESLATIEQYRKYIRENPAKFGLKPEDVAGLSRPVLVRVRDTQMGDQELVAMTQAANTTETAALSPVETAKMDAGNLEEADLADFQPNEAGDVLAASNAEFVKRFVGSLTSAERGKVMTAEGQPTKQLGDRIQAAIFAKAYDDDRMLTLMAEATDSDVKNIVAALTRAAPEFARARAAGELGDLNIVDPLLDAVETLRAAKREGQDLEEYLAQGGLFGQRDPLVDSLARFLNQNMRSSKRMGEAMQQMGRFIEKEMDSKKNASLFGQDREVGLAEIIAAADRYMVDQYGESAAIATGALAGEAEPAPAPQEFKSEYPTSIPLDAEGNPPDPVNNKPLDPAVPGNQRLICMACAAKKKAPKSGRGPALEVYDGPAFQTLRKRLAELPAEERPQVLILSAKHGVITGGTFIGDYNEKISKEKVDELLQRGVTTPPSDKGVVTSMNVLAQLSKERMPFREVMIYGSGEYRRAFNGLVWQLQQGPAIADDASIQATSGGIGEQRSQVGQWIAGPEAAKPAPKPEPLPATTKTPTTRPDTAGTVQEIEQTFIAEESALTEGSWDRSVIRETAKRISAVWKRLEGVQLKAAKTDSFKGWGWVKPIEITPKPRKGRRNTRETIDHLKWLRQHGYTQLMWDNQGEPYHAVAGKKPHPDLLNEAQIKTLEGVEDWKQGPVPADLNPKVANLVESLNRNNIGTSLSGDAYGDEFVYVDIDLPADVLEAANLPDGWVVTARDIALTEADLNGTAPKYNNGEPMPEGAVNIRREMARQKPRLARAGADPVNWSIANLISSEIIAAQNRAKPPGFELDQPGGTAGEQAAAPAAGPIPTDPSEPALTLEGQIKQFEQTGWIHADLFRAIGASREEVLRRRMTSPQARGEASSPVVMMLEKAINAGREAGRIGQAVSDEVLMSNDALAATALIAGHPARDIYVEAQEVNGSVQISDPAIMQPYAVGHFEYGINIANFGGIFDPQLVKKSFGQLMAVSPLPPDIDAGGQYGLWGLTSDNPYVQKYITRNEYKLALGKAAIVNKALSYNKTKFMQQLTAEEAQLIADKLGGITPAQFYQNVKKGSIEHAKAIAKPSKQRAKWAAEGRFMLEESQIGAGPAPLELTGGPAPAPETTINPPTTAAPSGQGRVRQAEAEARERGQEQMFGESDVDVARQNEQARAARRAGETAMGTSIPQERRPAGAIPLAEEDKSTTVPLGREGQSRGLNKHGWVQTIYEGQLYNGDIVGRESAADDSLIAVELRKNPEHINHATATLTVWQDPEAIEPMDAEARQWLENPFGPGSVNQTVKELDQRLDAIAERINEHKDAGKPGSPIQESEWEDIIETIDMIAGAGNKYALMLVEQYDWWRYGQERIKVRAKRPRGSGQFTSKPIKDVQITSWRMGEGDGIVHLSYPNGQSASFNVNDPDIELKGQTKLDQTRLDDIAGTIANINSNYVESRPGGAKQMFQPEGQTDEQTPPASPEEYEPTTADLADYQDAARELYDITPQAEAWNRLTDQYGLSQFDRSQLYSDIKSSPWMKAETPEDVATFTSSLEAVIKAFADGMAAETRVIGSDDYAYFHNRGYVHASSGGTEWEGDELVKRRSPDRIFPAPERKVHAAKQVTEQISLEDAQARIEEWKAEARRIGQEEDHSNEVIISLFDHSGQWSQPWADAGYDVRRYDIKDGDDLIAMFPIGDIMDIHESGKTVVGVLAACPCRSFSSAGAQFWSKQHDVKDPLWVEEKWGDWAAQYFDSPLEYSQMLVHVTQAIIEFTDPRFYALENPRGRIAKMTGLPDPTLTFDPHHYGDPYTKETKLWGEFNPNLPQANVDPTMGSLIHQLRGDVEEQKEARSLTPEGFSYSFFMANRPMPAPSGMQGIDTTGGDWDRGLNFEGPQDQLFSRTAAPGQGDLFINEPETSKKRSQPIPGRKPVAGMSLAEIETELDELEEVRIQVQRQIAEQRISPLFATTEARYKYGTEANDLRVRDLMAEAERKAKRQKNVERQIPEQEGMEFGAATPNKNRYEDLLQKLRAANVAADRSMTLEQLEQAWGSYKRGSITDIGKKIGGARKDEAKKLGPRGERKDDKPGWWKQYTIMEETKQSRRGIVGYKPISILEMARGGPSQLQEEGEGLGTWAIYEVRGNWPRKLKGGFATPEEADAMIPLVHVAKKHRVGMARDPLNPEKEMWAIVRQVTNRKRIPVKGGFESRDEAMTYMAQNPLEIINWKAPTPERPHIEKLQRFGPTYRQGNVEPQQFLDEFGFRGAEFGNWVPQDERQQILNRAYDGLMDMANVLQVPPRALSLNGELAIGFGSRGQGLGKAKAHYEPGKVVINLNRIKGAGSLAHEWFHAFDHYLARQTGKTAPVKRKDVRTGKTIELKKSKARETEDRFVSHGFAYNAKVREELRADFDALMKTITRRQKEFDLNLDRLNKRAEATQQDFEAQVDSFAAQFKQGLDPRYWKRYNKPAPADVQKQVDALAAKIKRGDVGEESYVQGKGWRGRNTYANFEKLSELYKKTRGRTGFAEGDVLTRLLGYYRTAVRARASAEGAQQKNTETRTVSTDYYSEAAKLDAGRTGNYYSTPHELGARAFESYVYDRLKEARQLSQYLVHSVTNDLYMPGINPYPEGEERVAIDKAFEKLFETVKTTDPDTAGNIAMYSRRGGKPLEQVQFTETAMIEETGELVEIETTADVRLRQIDKRIAMMEKIKECVRT